MWKIWIQEINLFSKMTEFVNFEAVENNAHDITDVDECEEMYENLSDGDFIEDENNDFDENIEDYYAFTNVSRSVEDSMLSSFINFDYS